MEYLTAEEIAAKLRVDPATVRRWIRAGQLRGAKFGRQYRVERAEYERFIAEGSRPINERNMRSDLALAR